MNRYAIPDAAALLAVPVSTMRYWAAKGHIKSVKVGGRYFVTWQALARFKPPQHGGPRPCRKVKTDGNE